jgi:glycosyltransferase involved in cell wall biosynthesis
MRIAVINVPIETPWIGENTWITVPPQNYGGIQWVVAHLIDGLLELGHEVFLLGAPGSHSSHPSLHVLQHGRAGEMREWLEAHEVDIIHDHSNSVVALNELSPGRPYLSTHHLTGRPRDPANAVYLSHAQKRQAEAVEAPVIRIPVNSERFIFKRVKQGYLLFLGRVSPWKGALEAAAFAHAAEMPLVLAGPTWEIDYLEQIQERFGANTRSVGEVGGKERLELLAGANAVLALSQPVPGPWGDPWSEPGSTVVSEAAASGTPVISSDNGCLAEITPLVGRVLPWNVIPTRAQAKATLAALPSADSLRATAVREWGHVKIGRQYAALYEEVLRGRQWR